MRHMVEHSQAGLPKVSVVVPVRNEAQHIGTLVTSLLAQDYPPELVEIIVADGMSSDGTGEILDRLRADYARVVVIDNPGQIVSTGLNAAIAIARGEIVIRIDGHSRPAPDFISQNVALLQEHPEAWTVGGPMRHVATTPFGKAVAVAMSHPIGVGNAVHRYPHYEGYSDSTAFPAMRRWVFDRVGLFDVRLVRNQDDEFNYRITAAGGKVFVSPRVRYAYYVRERPGQLFKQYAQYGFWRIPMIQKHGRPTTVRQLVPALFYVACAALLVLGVLLHDPLVSLALPISYATALVGAAAGRLATSGVEIALRIPLAIATMHAGYALGTLYGLWARMFRPTAWNSESPMAALSR